MKQTIVALLCVASVTCFAMNEKNDKTNGKNDKTRYRDIPRLLGTITEIQALSVSSQTLSGVATWEIVELQKRQAIAQENQAEVMKYMAHSNRLIACIATEEYTKKHFPTKYKSLNCQDIYENYLSLEKKSDQS